MTATVPTTPARARAPYMNWRTPVDWTAVVTRVEPDHLLLRDVGSGAVLLPGVPVLDGQEPAHAAAGALRGPDSEGLVLLAALIDRRQQPRRQVSVHTFVTEPVTRRVAERLAPVDGRSRTMIAPREQALRILPSRARLRAQFALAALEFKDAAVVEWSAWLRPTVQLGVPVGNSLPPTPGNSTT